MPTLFGRHWSRHSLERKVGSLAQVFGVTEAEYTTGAARGMRFWDVRTGGGLQLRLLPDRCLDIAEASCGGVPLSWRSSVGPCHPSLPDADSSTRASFQQGFGGGLLVTCGLRHFGPPAEIAGEFMPTHGRAHRLPAEQALWGIDWQEDEATLWAEGAVREARSGAENLELRRRYEFPVGGTTLYLHDVVTNQGFRREPVALLHHLNFGLPLVDEGSLVTLDGTTLGVSAGTSGFVTAGGGVVTLEHPGVGLCVEVRFSHPALQVWSQPQPGMNVLAIEPASHAGQSLSASDTRWLEPGEQVAFLLSVTLRLPAS